MTTVIISRHDGTSFNIDIVTTDETRKMNDLCQIARKAIYDLCIFKCPQITTKNIVSFEKLEDSDNCLVKYNINIV